MKAWGKEGAILGKAALGCLISTKFQDTLSFNLEASDSRWKTLCVYEMLYVTSLHLTPNLRVTVILPAESGSRFQIF